MKNKRTFPEGCTVPCNLCLSNAVDVLSLRDRTRNHLRTVICRHCGLIWTDPRPENSKLRDFYQNQYRKAYKGDWCPKSKHILRDTREAIRRHGYISGVLHKDAPVLDIGAGTGVFVYVLGQLGHSRVMGIEPDRHYAAFAAESFGIAVENAFLQDFQTRQTFKAVTLHHVLEHMEDPLGVLRLIYGLLEPGGFLALDVPNAMDRQQDPYNRYHAAHLYTFSPDTLEWLVRKAGFEPCLFCVEPYQRNISALLRRNKASEKPWELKESEGKANYLNTLRTLKAHTTARHFASWMPYRKFLTNTVKAVIEKTAVARVRDPREIVATVLRKRDEMSHKNYVYRYYFEKG